MINIIISSALSRVQNNDEAAHLELRSILHDMGLIEEPHLDKRNVELVEDENLEHGTNKINLIKVPNKISYHRCNVCKFRWTTVKIPNQNQLNDQTRINHKQQNTTK